eukprot:1160089-Pelagomonas_calceolata.AAC.5
MILSVLLEPTARLDAKLCGALGALSSARPARPVQDQQDLCKTGKTSARTGRHVVEPGGSRHERHGTGKHQSVAVSEIKPDLAAPGMN